MNSKNPEPVEFNMPEERLPKQNILLKAFLFAIIPGLFLTFTDQALFIAVRGSRLPLMSAIVYSIVFFPLAFSGAVLAWILVRKSSLKTGLRVFLIVPAAYLGLIFVLTVLNGATLRSIVSSRFLIVEAALVWALVFLFINERGGPGRTVLNFALAAFALLLSAGWALIFPEEYLFGEPAAPLVTAGFLALISAAIFLLLIRLNTSNGFLGLAAASCLAGFVALHFHGILFMAPNPGITGKADSGLAPSSALEKPNIIFIVWDTARKDHLSLYGYHRETTPYLESRAKESVVYTRAITVGSWTPPSHASMFTGLYPREHGMRHSREKDPSLFLSSNKRLKDEFRTFAEILAEEDYVCGAVSANFGWVSSLGNLDQGFHFFLDERNPMFLIRHFQLQNYLLGKAERLLPPSIRYKYLTVYLTADRISQKAINWIDSIEGERPFLLFLNYMDAHEPYFPPPRLVTRFPGYRDGITLKNAFTHDDAGGKVLGPEAKEHLESQYDAELLFLDEQLRALEDALKSRGLFDDSLIVLTSDHGQYLGEHGLMGHGKHVFNEELNIPLIVRYPGGEPTGYNHDPYENRELFYMVLRAAGINVEPPRYPWQAIAENYGVIREEVEEEIPEPPPDEPTYMAVYFDRYKYIRAYGIQDMLFDIEDDPLETVNLLELKPHIAGKGMELSDAFLFEIRDDKVGGGRTDALTPEEVERLKALGYMD